MEQVNGFQPSVIITLDNDMGGYGHPEYTFISQLVLELALEDSLSSDYIYQSVYTDHMENSIIKSLSLNVPLFLAVRHTTFQ